MNSSTKSQIIFIHVPKAAGTTFTSIIDSYYKKDEICPAYYMKELLQIPKTQLSNYKLIRGHFEYSVCDLFDNLLCMTMLRNPIQRVLSYYMYIRSNKNHILHEKFQTVSIMDILNDFNQARPISNHQTLLFGRDIDLDAMRQAFCEENIPNKPDHKKPVNIIKRAVNIDIAKNRLKNFPFVGITERFNDSLLLMAYTFGWPPVKNYKSRNITPTVSEKEKIEITFELNRVILEKNLLDMELYEFAQDIFEARFNKMEEEIANYYSLDDLNLLSNDKIIDFLDKNSTKMA